MIRVAVIGLGSMGMNHARVYSDIDEVSLVAVSDLLQENLKRAKKYCNICYNNYIDILEKEKIDIVSIAVPTRMHKQVAIECMNKGMNVLVEKPISSTISEAKEMIESAKKNNVKMLIGHIERFNPVIIELRKRIKNNELGKVFKVDVHRVGPFPTRIRDVGVVIDLAVHDIDIARYLVDSEIISVFAETETRIHTKHEDILSGIMRFKNNTICNLNINWLTPTKIRILHITGEKGMFTADYINQNLCFYENSTFNKFGEWEKKRGILEGKMTKFKIDIKEPLKEEIKHFIDCVRNNKEPLILGEDGLIALKIAQQLIKSAETHEVIRWTT